MNQAKGLNPDLDPEKKHQPAVRIPASSPFLLNRGVILSGFGRKPIIPLGNTGGRVAAPDSRKMGKYTLLEKLGAGGSGEVYLVFSKMQNDVVQFFAVKVLSAEQSTNPRAVKMLKREASLANVLKHNSIVSLYEYGNEGEDFYVAMDFVKGAAAQSFHAPCYVA
ncbi:MAG: protein kinase [Bdellovibrionales bacterium]|nr:protein kinase [Bdellovibrionales bacterium]